MKVKINFKFIQIYFYTLLTISICFLFCGNRKIDTFGLELFMFSTFPVFAILSKISFNKFSDGIESKHPDLFNKYKRAFGVIKRINSFEIFDNLDFDQLNDKEITDSLKLTKQLFRLTTLSFLLIIVLGVSHTVFKR